MRVEADVREQLPNIIGIGAICAIIVYAYVVESIPSSKPGPNVIPRGFGELKGQLIFFNEKLPSSFDYSMYSALIDISRDNTLFLGNSAWPLQVSLNKTGYFDVILPPGTFYLSISPCYTDNCFSYFPLVVKIVAGQITWKSIILTR